ncbi:CRISPR-associated endonuclease Cas6/Csy4 [Sporomusaceae bacterium FL31]|nr:CRISPR-associated endonuclease Cas6/Csy4 [Sporomusaceae bacterium FL31]GCE32621.1 CRISPR-associated endonuclease Cas6/Csy4 [Sporomusaceae bacterium]
MKYYQELTIIPSVEIPSYFIWSKVYQQLHLGFVENKDQNGVVPFGVSFPQYQYENKKGKIGEKMRVFASNENELYNLGIKKWLQRLDDYVHVTGIREVPEKKAGYAVYRRVHIENGPEQKARRFIKRHKEGTLEYEQAVKMFSAKGNICYIPYIKQKSLTNHNTFKVFIARDYCEKAIYNGFGTYGLSNTSTVPEF